MINVNIITLNRELVERLSLKMHFKWKQSM